MSAQTKKGEKNVWKFRKENFFVKENHLISRVEENLFKFWEYKKF